MLVDLNVQCEFIQISFALDQPDLSIELITKNPVPTDLFKRPIVVEVLGAGFEKQQNRRDWTLRHPRLTKIHNDRTITECMSFEELQQVAEDALNPQFPADSEEDQELMQKLVKADGKPEQAWQKSQSLSPNPTPHSATTLSLSPISAKKHGHSSYPMIRIDSNEMTPSELSDRRRSTQTTSTTSTSPDLPTTLGKRKISATDDSSPTVVLHKRQRATRSPVSPSVVQMAKEVRQASGAADRRDRSSLVANMDGAVSNTTSNHTKHPFGLPQSDVNNGKSKNRIPLSERINLSPTLKRQDLPQASTARLSHNEPPLADAIPKDLPHDGHLETMPTAHGFPFLPTPPSTSEEATNVSRTNNRAELQHQMSNRPDLQATNAGLQPSTVPLQPDQNEELASTAQNVATERAHAPTVQAQTTSSPLLLSSCLVNTTELRDLVQKTHASFTYSMSYFIHKLSPTTSYDCSSTFNIVLIDLSTPEPTAETILAISNALADHIRLTDVQLLKILFLDYHFLQHLTSTSLRTTEENNATNLMKREGEPYFSGMLQYPANLIDACDRRMAQMLWHWDEIWK